MDKKLSKIASIMGKIGGKKSAEKRLAGKSKEEISNEMRSIRYGKKLVPKDHE